MRYYRFDPHAMPTKLTPLGAPPPDLSKRDSLGRLGETDLADPKAFEQAIVNRIQAIEAKTGARDRTGIVAIEDTGDAEFFPDDRQARPAQQ